MNPAPATVLAARLNELGGFAACSVHRADDSPTGGWLGWWQAPELFEQRVAAVHDRLPGRSVPWRTAVSVTHLGLAARIVGVTVAARALGTDTLSTDTRDVWWQDRHGGPVPLSITLRNEPAAAIGTAVESVTQLVIGRFSLSPRVAWGNVASAANGAAVVISAARPSVGQAARQAADAILADPRVEGGVLRSGPGFRRRSCCLIHRADGFRGSVCSDCVLRTPG